MEEERETLEDSRMVPTPPTETAAAGSVLDNPVWYSLTGAQRGLGTVSSRVARFDSDVAPFGGFAGEPTAEDWREMVGVAAPANRLAIVGEVGSLPPGWTATWSTGAAQMVLDESTAAGTHDELEGADEASALGPSDVDEMLELVGLARPGPFLPRTVEFGGYLGIRRDGRLIAMAGERMRPPGFAEISAVATHPDYRRQGLGDRMVRLVADAIEQRGDRPFLHCAHENETAMRLYASMGFVTRRDIDFTVVEASPELAERAAQPD